MALTAQQADGMRFQATADGHTVGIDAAPEDRGGASCTSGPQLFLAAVGVGILELVLNSCRFRGVPVDRLSLQVPWVGRLEITIRLEPDPPADVKRRLLRVAWHARLVKTLARLPEASIDFAGTGG